MVSSQVLSSWVGPKLGEYPRIRDTRGAGSQDPFPNPLSRDFSALSALLQSPLAKSGFTLSLFLTSISKVEMGLGSTAAAAGANPPSQPSPGLPHPGPDTLLATYFTVSRTKLKHEAPC